MRWLPLAALALLIACNNSTSANEVAKIGWSFNYRDWTKDYCQCTGFDQSTCDDTADCTWNTLDAACEDAGAGDCTVDDIRDCTNDPQDIPGAPDYPPVTLVHVLLEDPDGVVPDWDKEFDCELGHNSGTVTVQGIGHQSYELTIEAFDADGTLLYDSAAPFEVDYGSVVEESYELRTPVGDLSFDVDYPHSGDACADTTNHSDCPPREYCLGGTPFCQIPVGLCPRNEEVQTLRYTLTEEGQTEVTLEGTWSPACDLPIFGNVNAQTLDILSIPSDPTPGATGGFLPVPYRLKVEGLDAAGDVLYCGTSERSVSPGSNTRHDSQPLTAGNCASWSCDAALYDAGAGSDCDCDCDLYDPDCDGSNMAVVGCVEFSVCEGMVGGAASCACMDYFVDAIGDCVWAGDPSGFSASLVSDLAAEDKRDLCTWMVNYAGGWGYEHDCGAGVTVGTGGVSECMSNLATACAVSDIELCYDAIKAEDPANPVADLCLLSTHGSCDAYRATCID